jgi:hypothetical protein
MCVLLLWGEEGEGRGEHEWRDTGRGGYFASTLSATHAGRDNKAEPAAGQWQLDAVELRARTHLASSHRPGAVSLAELTSFTVRSGTHGRFVFIPESRPDELDGCVIVNAAGPPGVQRTVQFATGETDEGLDLVQPLVGEGQVWVIRHPAQGQFQPCYVR